MCTGKSCCLSLKGRPKSSEVSRRRIVSGIAWATPAVAVATAAPAIAASPDSCTTVNMDWGSGSTTKLANGPVYTIRGTDTVYARVTYVETAGAFTGTNTYREQLSTSQYQLTVGKTAYGRVADAIAERVNWYTLNTTGGYNDLILNQKAGSGSTSVTIDFFSDSSLTLPVYVHDLQVPLDDFSTQESFSGEFTPRRKDHLSYQEKWSVVGTTGSGSVSPSRTGLSSRYNTYSTPERISGSGTPSDPWYFSTDHTTLSRNQVGGNLQTRFSQSVRSVTITYGSSAELTGPQGGGIGRLTMCV